MKLKPSSYIGKLLPMFFLSLLFYSAAIAQGVVSGKVVNDAGQPVSGATVLVKGTSVATQTANDGTYSISVPAGRTVLVVSNVSMETQEVTINGTTANVTLKTATTNLNEIVVVGYTTQRKKDIIGAVSVVNTKDLQATPSSNLGAQLQGRASGVTVSSSGEPGQGAVVRIRGFNSTGNNDPLYIVDGVPTTDGSKFNPNDVESIQILKDASAASIYGARASNGVVIITTKQGKSGRLTVSYDSYVGSQVITDSQFPELLNTEQYVEYLRRTSFPGDPNATPDPIDPYKHPVFGSQGSFSIPEFIVVSGPFDGGVSGSDPRANPDLYSIENYGNIYQIMRTSPGTNWFKELTQPALMTNQQLTISGGTDRSAFSVGMNYFDQKGTFKYTGYKRYSVRANSSFKAKNWLRFGENLQLSYEDRKGNANRGEGDAWAQAFRMVPYIPVYDIRGGWGGNGVGESGNGSNPIAGLYRGKDNTNRIMRIFGNVYAEVQPIRQLTLRTSFGADMGTQYEKTFTPRTYERSENVATAQLQEQSWYYVNWVWTNTATFQQTIADDHDLKLLVGTEAVKDNSRGVRGFREGFDFETNDFVSLNTGNATVLGNIVNFNLSNRTLSSLFGRIDYSFMGKYLLNATIRRDGSSVFGKNNRYATFPSVGFGWRISEESFLKNVSWLTDLKLRGGWGQMGSQNNVPSFNQYYTFGSTPSQTNYDINGGNTSSQQGYRANQEGNADTKWETTETTNIGLDATVLNGKLDMSIDVFSNKTKDLLIRKVRNGLEPNITKPFINIGDMTNKGVDIGLNFRDDINRDFSYNVGITFSHYKNKLIKLNEEGTPRIVGLERLSDAIRTTAGQPISSFYGYVIDGFFNNASDITNSATQAGAVIGGWRYKDLNNDKIIDDKDRTFLGNPHPDFQMGLNLGARYKGFDFTAFLFWNQGNEIYNYVKYYTDLRVFVGGISTRVLTDSWTPELGNNALLPKLGTGAPGDPNGLTALTSGTSNSYYVEDASYLRAKILQLGYTLPSSVMSKLKMENIRVYVQAQNLFTITKYTGPDPDLNIISRDRFNAERGDSYMGVDLSGFPNPKQFLFGVNVTF